MLTPEERKRIIEEERLRAAIQQGAKAKRDLQTQSVGCLITLLFASLFVWWTHQPNKPVSIPTNESGILRTVKSEGPFGTPVCAYKATAQAIEEAAKGQDHASERRFRDLAFSDKVFYLDEDTDVRDLDGSPGDYMRVRILEGSHKGELGWLLPDAHFRD